MRGWGYSTTGTKRATYGIVESSRVSAAYAHPMPAGSVGAAWSALFPSLARVFVSIHRRDHPRSKVAAATSSRSARVEPTTGGCHRRQHAGSPCCGIVQSQGCLQRQPVARSPPIARCSQWSPIARWPPTTRGARSSLDLSLSLPPRGRQIAQASKGDYNYGTEKS